jgi:hypothetical protein
MSPEAECGAWEKSPDGRWLNRQRGQRNAAASGLDQTPQTGNSRDPGLDFGRLRHLASPLTRMRRVPGQRRESAVRMSLDSALVRWLAARTRGSHGRVASLTGRGTQRKSSVYPRSNNRITRRQAALFGCFFHTGPSAKLYAISPPDPCTPEQAPRHGRLLS